MTNCLLTRHYPVQFTMNGAAAHSRARRLLTRPTRHHRERGLVMNASQGHYATRRTPEYNAWNSMRKRVKQSPYVERGITVCERWDKFVNFLADMGERPDGLVLARKDGNGNFEPGNCHWATSRVGDSTTTHGHQRNGKKSPTYQTWADMTQRCTNPNNPAHSYYADRGIAVCERWRASFVNFLEDMGERPEGLTLDREDNDGGYWCGHCAECVGRGCTANCRWATWSVQMKNRRPSVASLANLERAPGRVKAAAKRADAP